MDSARFDRLTPQQRRCLLGTARLQTSKQMAAEFGIAASTVDGYLTDAVKLLGARDRRDAARLLVEHEGAPWQSGGQSPRVSPPPSDTPSPPQPDRAGRSLRSYLPIRRKGQLVNDLPVVERLAWIPLIALGLAVMLALLVSVLEGVTAVAITVFRLLG